MRAGWKGWETSFPYIFNVSQSLPSSTRIINIWPFHSLARHIRLDYIFSFPFRPPHLRTHSLTSPILLLLTSPFECNEGANKGICVPIILHTNHPEGHKFSPAIYNLLRQAHPALPLSWAYAESCNRDSGIYHPNALRGGPPCPSPSVLMMMMWWKCSSALVPQIKGRNIKYWCGWGQKWSFPYLLMMRLDGRTDRQKIMLLYNQLKY